MRIQPKENYQLASTNISLDKTKIYPASIATNQPDFDEKEAIFVYYDNNGGAMILFKGEYTKTNKPCNINL
jgi:hypothetical protein|tara:strand:- start:504 stop:716 length:213 start_codon:yes stop_codon:yes gene_type:complete